MPRLLTFTTLLALAGCPGGSGQAPAPDAAARTDAAPPPPPDARLRGFGEACTSAEQCQSDLCVGETGGPHLCSRACSLDVALDCKDVDAFCVPVGGGGNACFGQIESGNDLDDAVLSVGDSVTRNLTPLGDADVFQVRLNQLGTIRFVVTPDPTIDVKLEAFGMLGDPLGFANNAGPGQPEGLETAVQQIGAHLFLVVRNVGSSTGGFTLSATKVTAALPVAPLERDPRALEAL